MELAPKASKEQIDAALKIVTKAVAIYRKYARSAGNQHPLKPAIGFKNFRRILSALRKKARKHALSDAPFGAFPEDQLKSSVALLYLLKLSQFQDFLGPTQGTDAIVKQALFNEIVGIQGTEEMGIAEDLLDAACAKDDREEDLAGYVYLAISHGLEIRPAMTRVDDRPMKTGCNYARLLTAAMTEAGAELPSDLRPLMLRGKKQAEYLLSPAIQCSDGRSYSYFAMFHDQDL